MHSLIVRIRRAPSINCTVHLSEPKFRTPSFLEERLDMEDRAFSKQEHPAIAFSNSSLPYLLDQASESGIKEPVAKQSGVEEHHSLVWCEFEQQESEFSREIPMAQYASSVPFAIASCGSNLDCFLEHTTPKVQCQCHTKASIAGMVRETDHSLSMDMLRPMPYFNLGDVWSSFDEWSAYGADVPLSLCTGESIVQYYVPYVSALQIYLHSSNPISKQRKGSAYDSDSSDDGDFSSDSELMQPEMRHQNWDTASSISSERCSSTEDGISEHGELAFEFFEKCSPCSRSPLREKIAELALDFPELLSLESDKLSPASWLSVAWYPIYRIPTGPTMCEMATCFLTFHSLWAPSVLRGINGDGKSGHQEDYWLRTWSVESGILELPAFGLASYKLSSPFWASATPSDKRRASCLARSAELWLKRLRVQHPDFTFFASRWQGEENPCS